MTDGSSLVAVILAAGKGTRMRSERPKVLHEVAGRPMLAWVLDAARGAGCERILAVVGHEGEKVRQAAGAPDVTWVEQRDQRGTGHALAQVEPHLEGEGRLLVLSGDVPLVSARTLERLVEKAHGVWGAMAVAEVEEPGALGRVLARAGGILDRIVEAGDATPEERAVHRVNAGLYLFPWPGIFQYLAGLRPDNVKHELYLTDAVTAAAASGRAVRLVSLDDPNEALGVNDRHELARAHRLLLARAVGRLADAGVTVLDPSRTAIEPGVEVARDTVIHAGVSLAGATRVGPECVLGQGVWIRDSVLGAGVVVEPYSVLDGAEVGPGCRIGPFARLRPGTVLGREVKVGNFVETKQARLGDGAKASHLTYLGDASVGEGANIGAGTVTCNYDGYAKHHTEIGRRASIGADTMLVAPVAVGDEAVTGAGSVITKDVPAGTLAVERSKQVHREGWAERMKRKRRKES